MAIRANQVLIKRFTASFTAGANTRQAFAHGLASVPLLEHCEVKVIGADDDVATPAACIVKVDSTNLTVKCSVNNTTLSIAIWRRKDDFGRPLNQYSTSS